LTEWEVPIFPQERSMAHRILLVDDEVTLRTFVAHALRLEEYEVVEAPDGTLGSVALPETPAHLIQEHPRRHRFHEDPAGCRDAECRELRGAVT
jgi:hypothetical protein